jgi:hypothetical protein
VPILLTGGRAPPRRRLVEGSIGQQLLAAGVDQGG